MREVIIVLVFQPDCSGATAVISLMNEQDVKQKLTIYEAESYMWYILYVSDIFGQTMNYPIMQQKKRCYKTLYIL